MVYEDLTDLMGDLYPYNPPRFRETNDPVITFSDPLLPPPSVDCGIHEAVMAVGYKGNIKTAKGYLIRVDDMKMRPLGPMVVPAIINITGVRGAAGIAYQPIEEAIIDAPNRKHGLAADRYRSPNRRNT